MTELIITSISRSNLRPSGFSLCCIDRLKSQCKAAVRATRRLTSATDAKVQFIAWQHGRPLATNSNHSSLLLSFRFFD